MVFIMSRLIGSNALRLLGRRGISISNVSPVKPLPPRVPRTSVAQTLPLEGKAPPMKKYIDGGYRINKCLGDLSRRAADEAIEGGRVTINGRRAQSGLKVVPGDVVRLDGRLQHWEDRFEAANRSVEIDPLKRDFIYVKYFKPVGKSIDACVLCLCVGAVCGSCAAALVPSPRTRCFPSLSAEDAVAPLHELLLQRYQ